MKLPKEIAGQAVSPDQETYLEGFLTGLRDRGLSFADAEPGSGPQLKEPKLIPEEKMKRELHPFDAFPTIRKRARENAPPEKEDVFRFKWNGLFWLGPMHEGYMCRLRIPGGRLQAYQLREMASVSEDLAWGYLQITTRSNLQVRVIQPKDTPELLRRIQGCGLHSRGAGADNLRNFTASPTAGVDPHELIDVMPLVEDLGHYVINHHEFYDLPRKFNVSFDGGGLCRVAEDTNDIGLRAVRLLDPPAGHPLHGKMEAGVYFRVLLGGVTGHKAFAESCGVICRPEEAVDMVAALTRVYLRNGNRSNRGKSRLIYLIKDWGMDRYLSEVEALLGTPLLRLEEDDPLMVSHELPETPHPHVGVHPQRQEGLHWVGVHVPVGLLQSEEARAIADIAERFGSGELRLTIYQNLLIPHVPDGQVEAVKMALKAAGLRAEVSLIRGGVAACTGNRYCRYASSDTKGHAMEVVEFLEKRLVLDQPLNIHVTGCPHSCAQHYIGDIGLLACKVKDEATGEVAEGYHVFVGGGFGPGKQRIGRQLFKSLTAGDQLHAHLLALLTAYLKHRSPQESFLEFSTRHDLERLKQWIELESEVAA